MTKGNIGEGRAGNEAIIGHTISVVTESRSTLVSITAGVSTACATLAALLVHESALWLRTLFIALLVITIAALGILLATALSTLFSWLKDQAHRQDTAENPRAHQATPAAVTAALPTRATTTRHPGSAAAHQRKEESAATNPPPRPPAADGLPAPSFLTEPLAARWKGFTRMPAVGLATCALLAGGFLIYRAAAHPSPAPPTSPQGRFRAPGSKLVTAVAFSPDGRTLVTANCTSKCTAINFASDGNADLFNIATGKRTATLTDPGIANAIAAIAISPDGNTIATSDQHGTTYLWNTTTDSITATLVSPRKKDPLSDLAFSPDGKTLATSGTGGTTYLWNTTTDSIIVTLRKPGQNNDVTYVAYSPDGRTLATSTLGGTTYLWNTATHTITATLTDPGNTGIVLDAAFSPDSKTFAAILAFEHSTTYLWNISTGKITARLHDPGSHAQSVAFSPNGKTVATADANGSTYLWNTATGALTGTLTSPARRHIKHVSLIVMLIRSVAFSPDGKALATANLGNSTFIWNMTWLNPASTARPDG